MVANGPVLAIRSDRLFLVGNKKLNVNRLIVLRSALLTEISPLLFGYAQSRSK